MKIFTNFTDENLCNDFFSVEKICRAETFSVAVGKALLREEANMLAYYQYALPRYCSDASWCAPKAAVFVKLIKIRSIQLFGPGGISWKGN